MTTTLFITLRWADVIDIFLVAGLMYILYSLVRGTAAIKIMVGIVIILAFWKVVQMFQMHLTANILGQFIGMGAIAVIIIFQPELRRFLLRVGTNRFLKDLQRFGITNIFSPGSDQKTDHEVLASAVYRLSLDKTGALIAVGKKSDLSSYIDTGRKIEAIVSSEILETIFFKNAPLHDGAVIIQGNKIRAAGCVLPITDRTDIPQAFGLRHRAAMGLAEISDAVLIVVSEERGTIFLFKGTEIHSIEKQNCAEDLKKYM